MSKQFLIHETLPDVNGNTLYQTATHDRDILLSIVADGEQYDFEMDEQTAERLITMLNNVLESML